MQKIILHGNLVKNSELHNFGERTALKFTVACNEGKGDKKVATYYDILSYATHVQPYLLKGKDVIVIGRLDVKKSERDGRTFINLNVYADTVELCGVKGESQPQQQPQPQPQPTYNDGLPF